MTLTEQSTVMHFFFFNDTATTEIYTLSLHDALPIYARARSRWARLRPGRRGRDPRAGDPRPSGEEEGGSRPLARGHGDGAPLGAEDLRDDDVRPGRDARRPHRAPVPGPGGSGTHGRLHRVHLLAADRKSTRLNSSHSQISYAVFCLNKKN